jgi:hypothetical protein
MVLSSSSPRRRTLTLWRLDLKVTNLPMLNTAAEQNSLITRVGGLHSHRGGHRVPGNRSCLARAGPFHSFARSLVCSFARSRRPVSQFERVSKRRVFRLRQRQPHRRPFTLSDASLYPGPRREHQNARTPGRQDARAPSAWGAVSVQHVTSGQHKGEAAQAQDCGNPH